MTNQCSAPGCEKPRAARTGYFRECATCRARHRRARGRAAKRAHREQAMQKALDILSARVDVLEDRAPEVPHDGR